MSSLDAASKMCAAPLWSEMEGTMNAAWQRVVRDPEKLDGAVESMTRCMASLMSLRDPEVDNGKTPWGKALYEEVEHLTGAAQLDELERIARAVTFVERSYAVAMSMVAVARPQTNVQLTGYSNAEAFYCSYQFNRRNPAATEGRPKLTVGGIQELLFVDVLPQVQRWLLECDAAMTVACHDTVSGCDRDTERTVATLATDLAERIANSLTLVPETGKTPLSTESLNARCMQELAATALEPENRQEQWRFDVEALKTLYLLVREGPKSPIGQEILVERLSYLQHLVCEPPVEFGLHGANAQQMNIGLFTRACGPSLDPSVRLEMMHQWRELHGAFAATAVAQAIQKLQLRSAPAEHEPTFCKVLYTPDEHAPPEANEMPQPAFVHLPRRWKLVVCSAHRTPYDWARRRCVRLSSLVLQLLGHGALKRGVISSKVVEPVAIQAALTSRVVRGLLDQKREQFSLGTRLLLFCSNVRDRESHLSQKVAEALSHVSRFSLLELLAVFSRASPAMKAVVPDLTLRTRTKLGNVRTATVVPRTYLAFVYDAMPFLLKAIECRRNQLGLPVVQPSNPVCDLLRELPKVRGWTPLEGTLRLSAKDLEDGPSMLPFLLKELSRRGLLVEYKRAYNPATRKKAPARVFVFDSVQLVAAMNGNCIARPADGEPME